MPGFVITNDGGSRRENEFAEEKIYGRVPAEGGAEDQEGSGGKSLVRGLNFVIRGLLYISSCVVIYACLVSAGWGLDTYNSRQSATSKF